MKKKLSASLLHIVVIIGFVISVFPVYWMFIAGTQSNQQILGVSPDLWIGHSLQANFHALMTNGSVDIFRAILNSIVIAGVTTIVAVTFSSMAGYGFARYQFRGRNTIFAVVLGALMIPAQVTLIPLFILMTHLHLIDTWWAIILPAVPSVFGVFLMRQAFLSFPEELIDAARIDGLSELSIYFRIVVPLSRSTLSALSIIVFLASWTNLLWPLVVLNNSSSYTIPVALSILESVQTLPNYGMVMLAASIATLPMLILFALLRRNFISGIMSGYSR